jgi:hypothetical protein
MARFRIGLPIIVFGGLGLAASLAVAGSGVGGVFNLGQVNGVNARTQLQGTTATQQLLVNNRSTSANSSAIYGSSTGGAGVTGVSTRSIGVRGAVNAATGVNYGVFGSSASPDGFAGYFRNSSTTIGDGAGIRALAVNASPGLFNPDDGAAGGEFAGPNGMIGVASHPAGAGVVGRTASADGYAGYFENSSTTDDAFKGRGIRALAGSATPATFNHIGFAGGGEFAGPDGVVGVSSGFGGSGVAGFNGAGRFGVYGLSTAPDGLAGFFRNTSTSTDHRKGAAVQGLGAGAIGNEIPSGASAGGGEFIGPNGVIGAVRANAGGGGIGVYAIQGSGFAALIAQGNAAIRGTLTKTAGTFKIDHPLDPANRYLSHSFVESPDMMNVYNGNVVTDARGEAVVELPGYFEALNRDPRYQLTVIGSFAAAQVAEEISDNHFTIRTSEPHVKVSWQVTGIRQDAYAIAHPIVVEEDKALADQGRYLHPVEHGMPASLAIGIAPGALADAAEAIRQ